MNLESIGAIRRAGSSDGRPDIAAIDNEQFDHTLKTNLYSMFWITQAARSHQRPSAAVINTASIRAYEPSDNLLDYAATTVLQPSGG